jgi:hypothetical protein
LDGKKKTPTATWIERKELFFFVPFIIIIYHFVSSVLTKRRRRQRSDNEGFLLFSLSFLVCEFATLCFSYGLSSVIMFYRIVLFAFVMFLLFRLTGFFFLFFWASSAVAMNIPTAFFSLFHHRDRRFFCAAAAAAFAPVNALVDER